MIKQDNKAVNTVNGKEYSELVNELVDHANDLINEYDYIPYEAAFEAVDNSQEVIYYDYNLKVIMLSNQDVNALETAPFTQGKEDNPREYMQAIAFCVLKADVQDALNEQ